MTYFNISSLLTSKNCQWVLKLTSKSKSKFRRIRWYKFHRQVSSKLLCQERKNYNFCGQTVFLASTMGERVKAVLLVVNPLSLCNFLSSPVGLCSCNVKVACQIKYCIQNLYFSQIKFPFCWGGFNWSSLTYLRLILGKKDG